MDEKTFKRTYKNAACTERPWKSLIPKDKRDEVLSQVKRECIAIYGYDFEECGKRKVCLTKACIGRPLEWKSPTARPYLEQFALLHGMKVGEEFFLKNCDNCPIFKTCTYSCAQVNDFLARERTVIEPDLVYKETLENLVESNQNSVFNRILPNLQLKWDCLSERKRKVIEKYLYDQKDFLAIAEELNLNNQARAKYEFYSALTRLSEYSVLSDFIDKNNDILTDTQKQYIVLVYKNNLSITEVAEFVGVSKQAVQKVIKKVIEDHKLKWPIFVRKEKNKVIYNVPEIMK